MRAAALLSVLALTGCYDPALHDCTVACQASADCPGGQVCAAGLCAATESSCSPNDTADASRGSAADAAVDARPHVDAAMAIDAAPDATITLMVSGKGGVVVDGNLGTVCASPDDESSKTCTYTVTVGTTHALVAYPGGGRSFDGWSGACSGADPTCSLAADHDVSVGASFGHDH